jgi:type 1 glutamine amidotransferase
MIKMSCVVFVLAAALVGSAAARAADAPEPLKVLLVAGGCCHDYATQTRLLKGGIEERIAATVTVAYNPDTSTKARFEIYEQDDWAKPYDVVIHDECSADVTEGPYVERILAAHRAGTPAVNIHCAMHSYRWGEFRKPVEPGADNAGWYEMIGLQSTGHGPQFPIAVAYKDHPLTAGLADWTTINEELYNNIQVMPSAVALATGAQKIPPRGRQTEPTKAEAVVAWTNAYGPNKTRIFSTSLGHNNATVGDSRYLDLICRGLLWTTGRLAADGTPADGTWLETGSAANR